MLKNTFCSILTSVAPGGDTTLVVAMIKSTNRTGQVRNYRTNVKLHHTTHEQGRCVGVGRSWYFALISCDRQQVCSFSQATQFLPAYKSDILPRGWRKLGVHIRVTVFAAFVHGNLDTAREGLEANSEGLHTSSQSKRKFTRNREPCREIGTKSPRLL